VKLLVPTFQDQALTQFLVNMVRELDRERKDVLSSNSGNRSVLLYSPSKYVFELTVSDTGVLSVTKVSG
jgi:hypothetical protein